MTEPLSVVFMGTPEFAVPTLESLCRHGHQVVWVVTQPDRPKGRGRKLVFPPVKHAALKLGCPVVQPDSIRTHEFARTLGRLKPDAVVVVAFGKLLPENILNLPPMGCINVHASLLPKYRGPAPIQWAIINGEKQTGVTTILMDKGMDTGDILLSAQIRIMPHDTSATLHDRLAISGADLLIQTLKGMQNGKIRPIAQKHAQASYAPLLKKTDGQIDWRLPATAIAAFVRGVTPWPGAFTFHHNKRLKIFKASASGKDSPQAPGTVIAGFPDELLVAAGKGVLSIDEIQSASGKRLAVREFLRGFNLPPGSELG